MYTASRTLEPEDFFWGNLAASMELLDAGTTTVLDHSHCNWSPNHSEFLCDVAAAGCCR